jgi:DNA-binding NarL/FixJ family response regulator
LSISSDQIRQQLSQQHEVTVVLSRSGTAAEIFTAMMEVAPDLLLIDRHLADSDGINIARDIGQAAPGRTPPVIVITGMHHAGDVARAATAGVRGYLTADQETWILNAAIGAVAAGAAWLSPLAARELLDEFRNAAHRRSAALELAALTGRELHVIRLIAQGQSNIEVARELGVSVSTVKGHVSRMLAKLQLRRRAQLAVVARDLGLM